MQWKPFGTGMNIRRMCARALPLVIALLGLAPAQTVTVSVPMTTPTQAIIHTVAVNSDNSAYSGNCTYRLSQGSSFGAEVNDVNTSLFASSNSDARAGSSVAGKDHYFAAGTRLAAQALDGRFYSRALQAATQHWIGVTCGAASEVGVVFSTKTIPLGNTYPEPPTFDSAAWGNVAMPRINWNDKSKQYIDPQTGVLLMRLSSPLDITGGTNPGTLFATPVSLVSGFTNVAYANQNVSGSNYATTSTAAAALFLPVAQISGQGAWPYSHAGTQLGAGDPNDLAIDVYCSGGGTLTAQWSIDSGQHVIMAPQTITCPGSFGHVIKPSAYPTRLFADWGTFTSGIAALKAWYPSTVNVSGTAVTWTGGDYFYYPRAPGTKLYIAGSSGACTNSLCTVASWNSPTSYTLVENPGTLSGVALQDYGAGLVITSVSGTVNFNATYDFIASQEVSHGSNGQQFICDTNSFAISTDNAGTSLGYTLNGYFCMLGNKYLDGQEGIVWIPAQTGSTGVQTSGESRLVTTFWNAARSARYQAQPSPFDATNPKVLYVNDASQNVWSGTLGSSPYLEWNPVPPSNTDQMTWSEIVTGIPAITAFTGPAAALATGLLTGSGVLGVANGYVAYEVPNPASTQPCIVWRYSLASSTVVEAFTSWSTYPVRWGACHSGLAPLGTGPYMEWTSNTIWSFNSSVPLGGPWQMDIDKVHLGSVNGMTAYTVTATSATTANPAVLSIANHGLDCAANSAWGSTVLIGPRVTIAGATGSWSGINGNQIVNCPDANHIVLPGVNSTSFGALTGTVTLTTSPPIPHLAISNVSTATPAVVTISAAASQLIDAEPIAFGNDTTGTQYFAKVTGYSATTFGVYADAALTTPVTFTSGAALNLQNGLVYPAETCPSTPPFALPANLDSGGAGLPLCMTFHVTRQPYSLYPATGEHTAYPCADNTGDTTRSCLQNIAAGDAFRDEGLNGYTETFTVLSATPDGSGYGMTILAKRWTPDQVSGGDDHKTSTTSSTHGAGWTAIMAPSASHNAADYFISAADSTHTWVIGDPNFTNAHLDYGAGVASGNVTVATSVGLLGTPDSIFNVTVANFLSTTLTYLSQHTALQFAGGLTSQLGAGSYIESYPVARQNVYSYPKGEQNWVGNWSSVNPNNGYGQSFGAGLYNGTVSSVAGMSHTYQISNGSSTYAPKITPTYAVAGHYLLHDISGPGSVISDASPDWSYCHVYIANECHTGSTVGQAFVRMSIAPQGSGTCSTNSVDIITPCFWGSYPNQGYALQDLANPPDQAGTYTRKLTLGLTAPGQHFSFANWVPAPGGWGFFSASFPGGNGNHYFAMLLPPFPGVGQGLDSLDRSTFVPYVVTAHATGAAQYARARFGYAENGAVSSFYCTSRQEGCSTDIPTGSPSDPYSFLSEAVTHQTCTSGCAIAIPAISGRVLYYVVDELDGSGNVVVTSPLRVVATP